MTRLVTNLRDEHPAVLLSLVCDESSRYCITAQKMWPRNAHEGSVDVGLEMAGACMILRKSMSVLTLLFLIGPSFAANAAAE